MALSKSDIQKIHTTKTAIPNKIYVDAEGRKYKGNDSGRLVRELTASEIKVVERFSTTAHNTQEILENLDQTVAKLDTEGYTEYTYDIDNNLTNINVWKDETRTIKIVEKSLAYTGDDLTSITITLNGGLTYTKNFSYDGNGNLTTKNIL